MEGNGKRDRKQALLRSLLYQKPSPEQAERIDKLRTAQMEYAKAFIELTNPGREQSLAITHLEDHAMWAVKSIALEPF